MPILRFCLSLTKMQKTGLYQAVFGVLKPVEGTKEKEIQMKPSNNRFSGNLEFMVFSS